MPKIDLDASQYKLLGPTVWANAAPLLSTSIMLTGVNLAPDLIPTPDGAAPPGAFELATAVVLILAWVLADTSIAFAVYPTLLTGGVLRGYEALRRAAFPRLAMFAGMQFLLLLVMVLVLLGLLAAQVGLGLGTIESVLDSPSLPLLSFATVVSLFLLGLALPDIVLTGRLSLRSALAWAWQRRRPLAVGLLLGAGPFFWAAEAFTTYAETIGPDQTGTVTIGFVALMYVSVVMSMLGSIMAAIMLAKTYRHVLPPEVLLEVGRVSEVFD